MWRGHITHVPSDKRQYLNQLEDIVTFIQPYLEAMGVEFGWWGRLRRGLTR